MRYLIYIFLLFSLSGFGQSKMLLASLQQGGGCSLTTGNIFPSGNAASECTDEANSTSGWSGVTANIASVSTGSPTDGDYAISITSTSSAGGPRGEYTVTVSNSTTYDVFFDYKVIENYGTTSGLNNWTGVVTTPNTTFTDDGAWHSTSVTVTTNSTSMLMRFYINRGAASQSGGSMLIDKVRVVPQ